MTSVQLSKPGTITIRNVLPFHFRDTKPPGADVGEFDEDLDNDADNSV